MGAESASLPSLPPTPTPPSARFLDSAAGPRPPPATRPRADARPHDRGSCALPGGSLRAPLFSHGRVTVAVTGPHARQFRPPSCTVNEATTAPGAARPLLLSKVPVPGVTPSSSPAPPPSKDPTFHLPRACSGTALQVQCTETPGGPSWRPGVPDATMKGRWAAPPAVPAGLRLLPGETVPTKASGLRRVPPTPLASGPHSRSRGGAQAGRAAPARMRDRA